MMPLLWILACGGPDDEPGRPRDGQVECRGLSHSVNLWRTATSALVHAQPEGGPSSALCQFKLSNALSGEPVTLSDTEVLFDLDVVPDAGTGTFWAGDTKWLITSGTLAFDTFAGGRATGTHDLLAASIDVDGTPLGDEAAFSGPFSWCTGSDPECPFRIEDGLADRAVIESPVLGAGEGGVTACRMLVDRGTTALQVDLQLGSWNHQDLGQLWTTECGAFGALPPRGNLLTYRTGGVTGPGTYGPEFSMIRDGGIRLPELSWEHPSTFTSDMKGTDVCSLFYPFTASVRTVDASACEVTVDDVAGRLTLECTDVEHVSDASTWPSGVTGTFRVEADCRYEER